jgi:hypothetical protein
MCDTCIVYFVICFIIHGSLLLWTINQMLLMFVALYNLVVAKKYVCNDVLFNEL